MKHTFFSFAIIVLLLGGLLSGCKQETDASNDPNGSGSGGSFVEQIALPSSGGNVTAVAVLPDYSVMAVMDNKLYSVPASGGTPQLFNSDWHSQLMPGPNGMMFATMYDNAKGTYFLRRYEAGMASFTNLDFPAGTRMNGRVSLRFSASGEIFIGYADSRTVYTNLYYSTDNGTTWSVIKHLYNEIDGAYTSSGELITVASFPSACYVIKTADHGATWDTLSKYGVNELGLNLFMRANGDLFAYSRGGNVFHVSHDGGRHFTKVAWGADNPYVYDMAENGTSVYIMGAGFNTQTSAANAGVFRSDDGGTTWTNIFLCATTSMMSMNGSTIALASSHGIFYTPDAKSWTLIGNTPLVSAADIEVDKNNNLLCTVDGVLYRLSGGKWTVLAAPGSAGKLHRSSNGNLYCGNGPTILYSTDNGSAWSYSSVELKAFYQWGPKIMGFTSNSSGVFAAVAEYNTNIDEYASGELLRSVDGGAKFTSQFSQNNFTSIFAAGNDLIGSYQLYVGGHLTDKLLSADQGKSWTPYTAKYPLCFNGKNHYLSAKTITGVIGFDLVDYATKESREIRTAIAQTGHVFVHGAKFGPDDRLYILILDGLSGTYKIFVSEKPVQ